MTSNVKRHVLIGVVLLLLAPFVIELTATRASLPQRHQSTDTPRGGQKVLDLYRNNCARCHGGDGRGDTPLGHTYNAPDFTDPEWWRQHSKITDTASLISLVSHGKGGMPAFGRKLSRSEINRLVGYVRRFKNQKANN
jgi:mono/diheme cytochrome c family protein